MLEMLLIEVFLKACVLCGLLYVVAKHEADYGFRKVAMISAGITLGTVLIEALAEPHIGAWAALASVAFIVTMLVSFCWISPAKSIIVVVLFCGVHFALGLLATRVAQEFMPSPESKGFAPMGATEEEFRELQMAAFGEVITDPPPAPGEREPEPAPRPAAAPTPPKPKPQPKPPTAKPAEPQAVDPWKAARKQLVIGGLISGGGGRPMVAIDGRLKEVGDIVSTEHAGARYQWTITSISVAGLELTPRRIVR